MKEFISRIQQINKGELDEREFYEQVLDIIKGMEDVSLTPQTFEQLKTALEEIGCMRYDEWKAQKDEIGEAVVENNMGKGMEQADISTAVSFVSQLLGDYDNASFSLSYMLDGGEKYGWVQQWLKNSRELYPKAKEEIKKGIDSYLTSLKGIKAEELDEREFYEQVLGVISGMEDVSLTPQTFEQLKTALEEIGCMRYDEWKAQKDEKGETVVEGNIGEGLKRGDISTAVSFVSQLLGDYSNASFSLPYMLEGGPEYGWVQQWLKKSQEISQVKHNIPYYQVAKQALMNWNGLSEEEAKKIVSTQTFDEIESQVYAKGSMDYAVEGIKDSLGLSDKDAAELSTFVYEGGQSKVIDNWKKMIELQDSSLGMEGAYNAKHNKEMFNNLIMDTLFHVHDGWVQDNVKKFNAREKKHQHMPSELIGWKEAKADLLFVRPIFKAAGIEVNEEELEQVYNGRVKDFFLNREIKTARNLSDSITQGEEFYPALEGYGDILVTINDPDYVDEKIIPAIEQQGIGNIEEVRRNIVSQIISNPVPEDVARLSDEEKAQVEQSLGQEVTTLTVQRDELHQKNSIVQRIMTLADRRRAIKKEISMEEQRKSENLHEFDD